MQLPLVLILFGIAFLLLLTYIILHWASYVPIKPSCPGDNTSGYPETASPSFSVVIITHDSEIMLERVIELVAQQDYPKFEILIVNNASTDNTNDVIKRSINKYPTIVRHTYLPQNKNGILHMSMATTLGVRAARNEWIVLLKPTSTPKSNLWLASIAQSIDDHTRLCIGYNDHYGYDNAKWVRKAINLLRKRQILNYRAIMRGKRKPIEVDNSNIAFCKKDFFDNGGYGKWLYLKNFHENLYATTYIKPRETKFLTSPDSQVETILPPIQELWETDRRILRKAYRKFSFTTKLRRIHYILLGCLYLLSALCAAASLSLALLHLPVDNTSAYIAIYAPENTYSGLPLIPIAAVIVFILLSLIHYIFILHYRHKDIKRLYTPLVSNPSESIEDYCD